MTTANLPSRTHYASGQMSSTTQTSTTIKTITAQNEGQFQSVLISRSNSNLKIAFIAAFVRPSCSDHTEGNNQWTTFSAWRRGKHIDNHTSLVVAGRWFLFKQKTNEQKKRSRYKFQIWKYFSDVIEFTLILPFGMHDQLCLRECGNDCQSSVFTRRATPSHEREPPPS